MFFNYYLMTQLMFLISVDFYCRSYFKYSVHKLIK